MAIWHIGKRATFRLGGARFMVQRVWFWRDTGTAVMDELYVEDDEVKGLELFVGYLDKLGDEHPELRLLVRVAFAWLDWAQRLPESQWLRGDIDREQTHACVNSSLHRTVKGVSPNKQARRRAARA